MPNHEQTNQTQRIQSTPDRPPGPLLDKRIKQVDPYLSNRN